MTLCEALLERLEAAVAGTLEGELAAHLDSCPSCRAAVERARTLAESAGFVGRVQAPQALVARLKTLPRLAPECEQALLLIDAVFEGELEERGRAALLDHVDRCPRCRACWEASATLREVGLASVAPPQLRARARVHPHRRGRVPSRRAVFDLRLATAAAYLLAAVSVLLAGDPARLARASSEGFDRATLYARAVVANRLQACSDTVLQWGETLRSEAGKLAGDAWAVVRGLLGPRQANRAAAATVRENGNGG
ncbi:MAG: zf-HC2 domain-containing protein [Thermoanaerobaculaceae bacterium]|nr:zf-HC2 domain-containing protein [Thermoanaerobaculaceae bacterium]